MLMTSRRSGLVAARRLFSTSRPCRQTSSDPRIWNDYASIRKAYSAPAPVLVTAS